MPTYSVDSEKLAKKFICCQKNLIIEFFSLTASVHHFVFLLSQHTFIQNSSSHCFYLAGNYSYIKHSNPFKNKVLNIAQVRFDLTVLRLGQPECWDYKYEPLYLPGSKLANFILSFKCSYIKAKKDKPRQDIHFFFKNHLGIYEMLHFIIIIFYYLFHFFVLFFHVIKLL